MIRSLIVALCCIASASVALGAEAPEIEIQTSKQSLRGKVVAHNEETFWLMERDGRLQKVGVGEVTDFRQVSSRFQSLSSADLRDQLRRELGNEYEIVGTGHYLVCAVKGEVQKYGGLFENLYRTLYTYCSTRGFRVREPEIPLVALVFPDQARFAAYSRLDGLTAARGLRGYYLMTSNRIALFEDGSRGQAGIEPGAPVSLFASAPAGEELALSPFAQVLQRKSGQDHFSAVDGDVKDTIIHEATHQVAFNIGLHTRIGQNPRWVVEGLATMFEPEGIRSSPAGRTTLSRVNKERFVWFGNFAKSRRSANSLEEFVASDRLFGSSILDAYSQAWALTFFLVETRSSQYSKYLSAIMQRDPLVDYGPAERVADFKGAFGSDIKMLEADFLRFIGGIK